MLTSDHDYGQSSPSSQDDDYNMGPFRRYYANDQGYRDATPAQSASGLKAVFRDLALAVGVLAGIYTFSDNVKHVVDRGAHKAGTVTKDILHDAKQTLMKWACP